jgi:hypothetical protein
LARISGQEADNLDEKLWLQASCLAARNCTLHCWSWHRLSQIKDAVGNDYGRPRDVVGESRHAFHAHEDSAFDVCFENILTATHAIADPYRNIELDIDIGADAKDWNAIQAGEKLKPVEAELKRVSEVASEIVAELDYLRGREIKLRDTNESTNERVKWFAIGTMGMLMALGAWQIVYLRAYFRSKHLI